MVGTRKGSLFRSHAPACQYREILVLIVIQGESYEEAALICGCAVGTVKSRLNRARHQLREEMGEQVEG